MNNKCINSFNERRKANGYIQNHINWCWAAVAKIVGLEYCLKHNLPIRSQQTEEDVIRTDLRGLRLDICGRVRGYVTVDAMQFNIVEHARDPKNNPNGDLPEGDAAKERALRYVISGSVDASAPVVILAGHYQSKNDLLSYLPDYVEEAIFLGNSFIGNYRRTDGTYHSVVLSPTSGDRLKLYDPWDGFWEEFSTQQIFRSGFLNNQGPGVIQWIQYIRPGKCEEMR